VRRLSVKAQFARDFIDLPAAAQIDGARWETFQVAYLNNTNRFGIDVKSRQIAWSFTAALDAMIDGILNPNTPHVFVSINLDEAKEKIRYCKAIHEAIRPDVRPALVRESQQELEFSNGSRMISHPCRPVRGKARARVYLDEMAHYKHGLDREIYLAALPATTKGDGYIRIGSSPLGAKGLFWEIATEGLKRWPGFVRRVTPWWSVRAFCRDVKLAATTAPTLLTAERVAAFGTTALIEIFENMFLEDFQQEYECAWVDELTAWITWDVIQRNQTEDHLWWHATTVDQAQAMIEEIWAAIRDGRIEPALVGGLDIGRMKDLTEFMALGKSTTGQLPLRFSVSLDRVEFEQQRACLSDIITRLPFTQVLVDRNGIGMQLAENLEKTGKAQGVDFTNVSKELWAVEARLQAERSHTPLPLDRDIAYQIHSIKKTTTAAKNNVFDTERNEKHHADKFWAWALAIWAAKTELVGRAASAPGRVVRADSIF
jgi:phage FluMu gp28-like protein